LFFQQSCVADKRLRFSDLKWARLDTLVGAVFTIVVAGCMVIVGNASKVHGIPFAGADGRCFAPIHRQRRSDSNIAPDAECCRAWNDGNLTLECLGIRRGARVAAQSATPIAGRARVLLGLLRVRGVGGGDCSYPARSAANDHPESKSWPG
jgi:hypothetical protein